MRPSILIADWTIVLRLALLFGVHRAWSTVTHWNKCVPNEPELWLYRMSKQTCEEECQARTDCQAIQYNKVVQKCGLVVDDNEDTLIFCKHFVYVKNEDMQQRNTACECPAKQRCRDNGTCEITECAFPTSDMFSYTGNMRQIGSSIKLECKSGMRPFHVNMTREDFIKTCLASGQFDVTDTCIPEGTVWQSSTMGKYTASLAVDGDTNQEFYRGSCSHTNNHVVGAHGWWMIDFEESRTINQTVVYLRDKCCYDRFQNVSILVSDSFSELYNYGRDGKLCEHYTGPATKSDLIVTFNCAPNTTGRFLKVITQHRVLTMCEIQFS